MGCCNKTKKPEINRALLPVKAQQFFYYGGVHSMFAYVSLHLRLVGLSIADITIISSFIPIAGILGAPLIGLCTDVFGRYKLMAGIVLCTTATVFTSFLLIPLYGHENRTLVSNLTCSNEQVGQNNLDKFCDYQDGCSLSNSTLSQQKCGPLTTNQNTYFVKMDGCVTSCVTPNNSKTSVANVSYYDHSVPKCIYQADNMAILMDPTNQDGVETPSHFCPKSCEYVTSQCRHPIGRWEETFYPFLVLRLFGQFVLFSCYSLVDTTTIGALKKHGGKYGKQRIFSHLAQAIFPFMSGAIMDAASAGTGKSVIWPAYALFDICLIVVIILLIPMTLKQEKIEGSTFEAVKKLATHKPCFLLFILSLLGGIVPGFMGVFLTIYLKSLNSPMYIIGLTSTSGALTSIVLMYFSDRLVVRLGYLNTLCTGFLLNSLTVFCYSLIQTPEWAVLLGTTRAFTQNVCWVALIKWNGVVAPKELLGTTLGTIRAFTYGLGRTIGVIVGGALMIQLGERRSFQVLAAFYAFIGIFWLLLYHFCLKRHMEAAAAEKEKLESPEIPMGYTNPIVGEKLLTNPEEINNKKNKETELMALQTHKEMPPHNENAER